MQEANKQDKGLNVSMSLLTFTETTQPFHDLVLFIVDILSHCCQSDLCVTRLNDYQVSPMMSLPEMFSISHLTAQNSQENNIEISLSFSRRF